MKDTRYYPFERNRYFYGKLLTVRDFESEQKYINDKRRLINRLLHGAGVISGLQVVAVDDKTISVEMGAALDALGREIIVASPVTLKLSMIEGFTNNEYAKNVYLYIAYDEKGKEPVHSVGNASVRSEEVSEHNRVLESYKLFIREEAPELSAHEALAMLQDTCLIYEDSQVRIWQTTPRYVNPGDVFPLTLHVEKTLQTPRITFSYEVESTHFQLINPAGEGEVAFREPADQQQSEYTVTYLFRAVVPDLAGAEPVRGTISPRMRTIQLSIGDRQVPDIVSFANQIEVITEPVKQRILTDYHNRSLDQSLAFPADQGICLAKIALLQMGPTYMIEQVEPVPFQEYIYNSTLLYRLGLLTQEGAECRFTARSSVYELPDGEQPQLAVSYEEEKQQFQFNLGLPKAKQIGEEVATGVVEIPLDQTARSGVHLFVKAEQHTVSEEIAHGLGPGQVFVSVGLEEVESDVISDILDQTQRTYYGDLEAFDDEFCSRLSGVSLGVVVYPRRGTFRIGLKTNSLTEPMVVRVRWWALRKRAEAGLASQNGQEVAASSEWPPEE
ncbi:hypothetical protein LOK74_12705 [Brevibacillus humidisoli]|uniref:hypothetical protein n=1 Tax=Brevibacillus humidisoli TaxID=2895522 RepID=UPI001E564E65|nr:hypothetical protein [Brevibacillus humidisoli]UFJ38945.1 hypothetical protein LOK74_12705 [Brevibacillus humidisoli]